MNNPQAPSATTNKRVVFNTWITGMLIPIGLGIFWKCVQIYNIVLLQHTIDDRQDRDISMMKQAITSITELISKNEGKDNERDKDIIKLQGALTTTTRYRREPGY